jgi:hypothetical protein
MTVSISDIFKKLDRLKQVLCRRNSEVSQDLFLEELDVQSMQKNLTVITRTVEHLRHLRLLDIGRNLERAPTDLGGLSFRRKRELPAHLRKMQSLRA